MGADIQSKVLAFAFGLSAEIERNLISQRTKETLARKKAEGLKATMKYKLDKKFFINFTITLKNNLIRIKKSEKTLALFHNIWYSI